VRFLWISIKSKLMKTKAISSFFVLFAIVAGIVAMTPTAFADHSEVIIVPAIGSGSSQDCIDDAEGCYLPSVATVDLGGTVIFSNTDTAAHTWSEGTAADATLVFDTSMVMAGASYEYIPDTVGEFSYFCMVHPWMVGLLVVQEAGAEEAAEEAAALAAEEAAALAAEEAAEEAAALAAEEAVAEELMVEISSSSANEGEMLTIDVTFTTLSGDSVEHINYDIKATQNGEVVLDDAGVHDHNGIVEHTTAPLPEATSDDAPVNVEIIFNGYGLPGDDKTGPIGQVASKQVVPEFGTITMMILAVAIISIVAITAKSRVIPKL
jgi:predicted secreted protein with PEFG-CTERM motif